MTKITTPSLHRAIVMVGDVKAIKRGYVSQDICEDATILANAAIALPTFGKLGYLGYIGSPNSWWSANCVEYKTLSGKYRSDALFSSLLKITNELIKESRINVVRQRVKDISTKQHRTDNEVEECACLENWLFGATLASARGTFDD